MAELAVLQAEMARALLAGRFDAIAPRLEPGPIPASEALSVHRNTAVGGLVNALRLGHPTVLALVGEDFFDQAARAFAERAPPSSAWLTGYGEGFADFLAAYEPARELPYLADVARFDFAVEAVACAALGDGGRALDLGEAVLTLDASLRLVDLDYPADLIRDALGEDEERLTEIDMRRRRHTLALWRLPDGAGLRRLSPVPAAFVKAGLHGEDLADLQAPEADLAALSSEVFTAPFVRLSPKPD
ncbi:MAG: HvfC/BufC family peptide modification chaperone [Caulobacteraceae bacterium]